MKIKMVVTDLDGTLLDDQSRLPEANRAAVQALLRRGVGFVISSGRSFRSLDRFASMLGLKTAGACGIAFNGSVVYRLDGFHILRQQLLKQETLHYLLGYLRAYPDADLLLHDRAGQLLSERDTEGFRRYWQRAQVPARLLESFDAIQEDISKILLRGENACLQEAYRAMSEGKGASGESLLEGRCNMFFSGSNILEFTALGADKGAGLIWLADFLGIPVSEVVAVGDHHNDISMLRAAGFGIAPANAVAEAKAAAGYVTARDNNAGIFTEVLALLCSEDSAGLQEGRGST